jgi:hypothetical protein
MKDLLAKSKSVTEQGYTPYQNPRLANFSGDTNDAFDMIRDNAAGGTPAINAGINAATGAAGYNAAPITAGSTSTGSFDFKGIPGANLDPYFNPYTSNVLDVQKQRANQTFQEQQAGRDAGAVAAGAFGGDRRFVQDSLARRDLNTQLQGIEATGLQEMFDRGTSLFQNDENRRLSAYDADAGRRLESDTGNVNRGLQAQISSEDARRSGAGLGLDAASLLGQLGQTKNDIMLQNAEALSGVGAKKQQREQAGLDMAYKDFTDQRDWTSKQLGLYSQLLGGTPVSPNTTTTVTEPAPDFLSQLLGIGTGVAGIWDLLN